MLETLKFQAEALKEQKLADQYGLFIKLTIMEMTFLNKKRFHKHL